MIEEVKEREREKGKTSLEDGEGERGAERD